jgi:hypothetical protein
VLRKPGQITVDVLDSEGESVRTLVRDRDEPRGRVSYVWDGRDESGRIVPEARYRPRVQVHEHGRTIVLPTPIRVDTTAPRIRFVEVSPRVFSPDGDGRNDRVTAKYAVNEIAQAMLLVDGRRRVLGRLSPRGGRLTWLGQVAGRPVRPGVYECACARWTGRNWSPSAAVPVRCATRAARERSRSSRARRFGRRCLDGRASYRWLLRRDRGNASAKVLRLRAPRRRTYTVYVRVGRWADRAEVVVTGGTGRVSSAAAFVLGVSWSGTTMLRVILDRSRDCHPDETFVPQLAHAIAAWSTLPSSSRRPAAAEARRGAPVEDFSARFRADDTGEALDAVFGLRGGTASRAGRQTPMYMRHLGLIGGCSRRRSTST